MIKKALVGVGILLVGGLVLAKTDCCSYVGTIWKQGKAYAKKQVPVEFEIKRAKDMLANLEKVEDRLITVMANEMVAMKRLEREVAEGQDGLDGMARDIQARNDQLKAGTFTVSRGVNSSREQFALELERRFKRFKTAETTLKTKKDLLAQHQERLAAVKEQRDGLKGQKTDLASRIESLETQVALLRAAEARSKAKLSDSQIGELNQIKELIDSLEQRLETSVTELQLREEIKASQPTTSAPATGSNVSLSTEIDEYFGKAHGKVAAE
jgi:chromosome segregation ATPase